LDDHTLTQRLLFHGALWIGLITALDVGTSWIMMSLRGVSSEGNATMRLLFENRDLPTLLQWLSQQSVYISFAAASILLYFVARFEPRITPKRLSHDVLVLTYRLVIALTWFFALLRLYYGPPSNTITILQPFGELASLAGAFLFFVIVLWVMLSDMGLGLIIRQVFEPGMLSRDPRIRTLLDAVPMPDEATSNVALSLAKDSADHLRAAKKLYDEQIYAGSISSLQQSVETAVKSTGLLLGTIPNDPKVIVSKVGHHATRALLFGMPQLVDMVRNTKMVFTQMKTADILPVDFLKGPFRRFDKQVARFASEPLPPADEVARDIQEVMSLTDKEMWSPTLHLDRTNKWVGSALVGLEGKPIVGSLGRAATNAAIPIYSSLELLEKIDVKKVEFVGRMSEAFKEALWLSLLLDWHWESSRYSHSPISINDYWTVGAYTLEQPLVKEEPTLFKYASRLSGSSLEACKVALEYHKLASQSIKPI
jgi:hypothetical protein